MKKIILCSPQLGISPQSNSGGEVYDREVLSHLAKKGVKILSLLPKNRPFPKLKNLKVSFTPIQPMFPPYIFNFFVFPYLLRAYHKYHFNILRVHSPYFVGPAAVLFKKFYPQVPIVVSYLHLEDKNFFQSIIDKKLIDQFDHLMVISNFTKKEIIRHYQISSKKITVSYPGVALNFKKKNKNVNLLKKFNLKGEKILLFLGGLKKRKNPLLLIDILRKIKDKKVKLLVAGDGPLKEQMINNCQKYKLFENIVFTGFVKEKEKVDFYNLADIVLLPSKKEGFGMIAVEAQACGKPIIVSANSSLPEVIKDGKTGFLAKTNDIDDWLKKINLLLKKEKLRKKMGSEAIKYVRSKFSWQKNAKLHLQIFEKLLTEKRK